MKTKTVKTNELKVDYPDGHKGVVWCVGSVRDCADHACIDFKRKLRNTAEPMTDAEEDTFDKELRKKRKAELRGYTFVIEPITEEYEDDEEED